MANNQFDFMNEIRNELEREQRDYERLKESKATEDLAILDCDPQRCPIPTHEIIFFFGAEMPQYNPINGKITPSWINNAGAFGHLPILIPLDLCFMSQFENMPFFEAVPKIYRLCSKGYDVFGWIQKGWAISLKDAIKNEKLLNQ